MSEIDPMSIAVCTPTYDGKLEVSYTAGLTLLAAHRRMAMPFFLAYCSNVAQARNRCVHWFLHKTDYQHLVFIDADIGFGLHDWDMLMEGDEECVCAEYRKKDQTRKVRVLYGLGFARISRAVLEGLAAMRSVDEEHDMLLRFRMEGEEWIDYFPQGVVTGDTWRGEDHGFWLMVQLAGFAVRIERRTHLMHTGVAHFPYEANEFPDELSPYADPEGENDRLPDPVEALGAWAVPAIDLT